jgi:hypothetical protein
MCVLEKWIDGRDQAGSEDVADDDNTVDDNLTELRSVGSDLSIFEDGVPPLDGELYAEDLEGSAIWSYCLETIKTTGW